jgi:hypothetical protein
VDDGKVKEKLKRTLCNCPNCVNRFPKKWENCQILTNKNKPIFEFDGKRPPAHLPRLFQDLQQNFKSSFPFACPWWRGQTICMRYFYLLIFQLLIWN